MMLKPTLISALAEVRSGGSAPQESSAFTATGRPFVRAGSLPKLLAGATEESLEHLEPAIAGKYGLDLFPAGTVLFAKSGMSATKGHVYRLRNPAFVVSHLAALVPHDPADSQFLVRLLKRFSPTALIRDPAYPSIRLGDIENMKVFAPPEAEGRRRVAEVLDRADALRAKRCAALALLDTLTHAIFLDMFGDPTTNPKGWAQSTIGGVAEQVTDGEHLTPKRSAEGIKLLSARNIRDGYLAFDDVDYIDAGEYERIRRRCDPARGDVLISCSGTIGRVASVETEERFSLVRSAALVRPRIDLVSYKFLEHYLRTPALKARMLRRANASSQANLFQGQIRELPVFVPPLGLQQEFAHHIASTQKVKDFQRASLCRMDILFASLQHRAFRGELWC